MISNLKAAEGSLGQLTIRTHLARARTRVTLSAATMVVTLTPDFPITDEACREATGKTFGEWFAAIEEKGPALGRREIITWIYDLTGRGKDVWWATTIWVEFEAARGIVNKKDGLAEGYNICATKSVKASAEAVYDAFAKEGLNAFLGSNAAVEGGAYTDDGGNEGTWARLRTGKDVRITWKTNGVDTPSLVDASFKEAAGKTAITVTHSRIQTRDEADGLRTAWGEALAKLKTQLEA